MKYSLRSLMTFSIRDIALVTVIVALAVGWWVDRSRLASRAKKGESFRTLSDVLATQLQNKNQDRDISIIVDGDIVSVRTSSAPAQKSKISQVHLIAHDPAAQV